MIKLQFTKDRGRRREGDIVGYDENSAQHIIAEGAAVEYVEPSTETETVDEASTPEVVDVGATTVVTPPAEAVESAEPVELDGQSLVADPTSITEEQAPEPAPKSTRRKSGES